MITGGATMLVREVQARSILSASKIHPYALNPYTGCEHACSYCYARFMKRFSGHREPWGAFVDVKTNAPDLLRVEKDRRRRGNVWVSGVCDPYQPLEGHYRLTRRCLEILVEADWPVTIQTRSPLVLRDLDVLAAARNLEVGLSITTADDRVRAWFEPAAPTIDARLDALRRLREAGIRTFVMIAPMLPGAEGLPERIAGNAGHILVDRMNYDHARHVYRRHGLESQRTEAWFDRSAHAIALACRATGTPCRVVFR